MKRLTTLILILLVFHAAKAQNLVSNGDFETYSSLPTGYAQYYKATGWSNVNNVTTGPPYGSPDYFNVLGTNLPAFGPLAPNTGNGQMGFFTYHIPLVNAREYISTQLNSPLIPGQQYQLSFFLTNGTGSGAYQAGVDNFGIHFSVAPLVQLIDEVIQLTPTIEIPGVIYITNTWQQYNFTFIAPSAANHITFGNFELDVATTVTGLDNRAYYFIDDIVLTTTTLPLIVQGDSVICAGEQTTLTAINDSSYAWAIDTAPSVILSNNSSITVSPLVTTTYLVYGTSDTVSFTVTVNNPPVVSLGNDTTLCQGETLLLDATTPGGTYIWQNNSTASTFNVTQSGTYFVNVTVNGCSAIDTVVVAFTPTPLVNLGADTTLCSGQSIVLNAAVTGGTYLWQDNSSAPTFTVTQSGTYYVQVTANNCSSADTINVVFAPIPVVALGNDTTLCQGETLILNASTSGATYLWQDNSVAATYSVTQPGMYFVNVTVNGCSAADTVVVAFTPAPLVNLGADTTLCTGLSVTLNAAVAGGTYLWQDNSSGSTYTVTQSGTYYVQVTANNCSSSDTINVAFAPIPVVSLGNDTTLCQGQTVVLNASTPSATYLWQDNSTGATYNVTQPGTYFVNITLNGCSDADTVVVAFTPTPIVNLGADTTLCAGQTITLSASVFNGIYLWQDNSSAPTFTVTQAGTYFVLVTANNCSSSDTVSITYTSLPVVSLGNDTTLCQGETLVLNASTPGATYLWQDNSTGSTFVASQNGNYAVTVTVNNCSASDAVNVVFVALPSVNLGADTIICNGTTLTLDATTSGATYLWNDNSGLATLIVGAAGIYWTEVNVSGCRGTDSITVMLEDCEVIFTLPNIFTPNNDGLNDMFVPIESKGIVGVETLIFNRYGQEVYKSSKPAIEWNGKTDSGNEVTDGTYYWIINYTTINGTKKDMTGSLKLIR